MEKVSYNRHRQTVYMSCSECSKYNLQYGKVKTKSLVDVHSVHYKNNILGLLFCHITVF